MAKRSTVGRPPTAETDCLPLIGTVTTLYEGPDPVSRVCPPIRSVSLVDTLNPNPNPLALAPSEELVG